MKAQGSQRPTPWLLALTLLCLAGCKNPGETRAPPASPSKARVVAMAVTGAGFEPSEIVVKKGEPLELVITRLVEDTCATDLLISGTDIKVALPLNQAVTVRWTPEKAGQVKYGCAMDMMISGVLLVE